jgi:hypothetical protein
MNLKALITTLVLGSSSVAMAHPVSAPIVDTRAPVADDCDHMHQAPAPVYQPAPIYQPAPQPAPVYLPVRQPMPPQPAPIYQEGPYQWGWTTLGGVSQIADGAMAFRVGRSGEQFSKLKLQSDAGKSLISRVLIQFTNGRTQAVEVNQYLTASNPAITIDLDGRARAIAKVTVIGRNARQSAYRVLAI